MVGIILTPLADWLASLIQQFVSTTIVTPFVAMIWTLVYYRLLGQKQEAQAPAPEAEPAT